MIKTVIKNKKSGSLNEDILGVLNNKLKSKQKIFYYPYPNIFQPQQLMQINALKGVH